MTRGQAIRYMAATLENRVEDPDGFRYRINELGQLLVGVVGREWTLSIAGLQEQYEYKAVK